MSYLYISSMTGVVSQDIFYLLAKKFDVSKYLKEYAHIEKGRRTIIPAVLDVEYEVYRTGNNIWTGQEIYDYLIARGYTSSTSLSTMKLFAANVDLVNDLLEDGYSEEYTVYLLTYLTRLRKLGFERIDMRPSYAMGMDINIYPIDIVHIEVPEPPEVIYEEWRPFQISMLVDCTTHDINGIESTRKIEFRGVFSAEKNEIVDWDMLGALREVSEDMLKSAGIAAESIIKLYARIKGYEELIDRCAQPEFYGANLLESIESDYIDEDIVSSHVTECFFEVVDIDYGKTPFTDKILFTGKWWEDARYYNNETETQVPRP